MQPGKNILLGLVSLAAVAGVIALLLLFGELEALIKHRYVLVIDSTNAAGLRSGSHIELNGVPVGIVDDIVTTPDPKFPVRIRALIDRAVLIPADVAPYATASLLGGSATLQLEAPTLAVDRTLPTDGSALISGVIRSRLIEQVTAELDSRLGPLGDAMLEFRELARNLNEMVKPLEPGEDPLQARNLRTAVERLNLVLADTHETLELAKEWLGDEQLQSDTRQAVSGANRVIEQAGETFDEYSRLAARLDADVAERLPGVLGTLSATLEEIRVLARQANEGDGTVAQLMNNPDLYKSLDDAARQLEETARVAKLVLEKFRDEGIKW